MKFSCSLLQTPDIGQRIFQNAIEKTQKVLFSIFALQFNEGDPRIKEISEDETNHTYTAKFDYNGREIIAALTFEGDEVMNDICIETLAIVEDDIKEIIFLGDQDGKTELSRFRNNVLKIQEGLEAIYELSFLPLDPAEKDKNILDSIMDEKNPNGMTWSLKFKQQHHEGYFEIKYTYASGSDQKYTFMHFKRHVLYFD